MIEQSNLRKKQEAEKVAMTLMNFVNQYGADYDTFADYICREHRTLQQSFMRLFIYTVEKLSHCGMDDRNREAIDLARKIAYMAKDHELPFI